MSEATPEPDADRFVWVTDPKEFGPADIEGNPPESYERPDETGRANESQSLR